LVSVPFAAGGARVEGFLGEGVSDLGGLTPFIVSIPSTVTVLPSGSFAIFSSFLLPKRPEQEVREKRRAAEKTKMVTMDFLF
jgi:hypothetical protein